MHNQLTNKTAAKIMSQCMTERDRRGLSIATQLQIIPSIRMGVTEMSNNSSSPMLDLNPPPKLNRKSEPKIRSDEMVVFTRAIMSMKI